VPDYTIRDPQSGKTLTVRGDSPPSEQELEQLFSSVNGPAQAAAPQASKPRTWTDTAVDALPAIGGTVGGIVGGIGGTVAGFGVGGVPGAVGGAAVGGAGGEAVRRTVNQLRGTMPVDATAGQTLGAIGQEAAIQGGAEALGGAVTKGASALGTAVYRGYLKPSLSMVDLPKAREIVATGIREMLPITKAGEVRALKLINGLNDQVTSIVASAKGKVDLHSVAERVRAYAKKHYFKPGIDDADYKAALGVADTLDNHPSLGLPPGVQGPTNVTVSPADASEIKRAVRPNSRTYGQQGSAPEAATRKAAGSELRSELEKLAPKIGPLNERERKLIDALDALKHAAGREENRSAMFGVPTLIAGTLAGGAYGKTDDPTTAAVTALVARGVLSPAVASRAAFLTTKFARVPGTTAAMALRMGAILALRETKPEERSTGR
jgi:hypothetical protein